MELKNFLENLKIEKGKDSISALTLAILKSEEVLIDYSEDSNKVIEAMKALLEASCLYLKENKIEVNNSENPHLDLDHWKDNVKMYSSRHNLDKFEILREIRYALRVLLEVKKDLKIQKIFSFEIIIKTFLLIDSLNLSIDVILAS